LVVPLAAGGGGDIVARIIAQALSNHWQTNVIVDNRPGAGGNIGNGIVANSTADGHTLLATTSTIAISPAIYPNGVDVLNSLQPISLVASQPSVLLVSNNLKVTTIQELVTIAKQRTLKFGSAGIGTASHLANELFAQKAGVSTLHVPYRSAGQSTQGLLSSEVDFSVTNMATAITHIRSKRLTAIATTSAKRVPELPQILTIRESGINYEYYTWYGVLAPRGISAGIQQKIHVDLTKAVNLDTTKQTLSAQGLEAKVSNPREFERFIRTEIAQWKQVVKQAKIGTEP
jgi:tripartite-type tricarboxylate transporter receptor subunit TctC